MKEYTVRRYFTTYQDFVVEAENEQQAMVLALAMDCSDDKLAENVSENCDPEVRDIN